MIAINARGIVTLVPTIVAMLAEFWLSLSLRPFGCVGVGTLVSIVDDAVEDPSPVDVDVIWGVVAVDKPGKEEEEDAEYDD